MAWQNNTPASKLIFDKYDTDRSGVIDKHELLAMCTEMGRALTPFVRHAGLEPRTSRPRARPQETCHGAPARSATHLRALPCTGARERDVCARQQPRWYGLLRRLPRVVGARPYSLQLTTQHYSPHTTTLPGGRTASRWTWWLTRGVRRSC
eukprot:scaffold56621_cov54-Phaeocystis_antarctica.AAC.2